MNPAPFDGGNEVRVCRRRAACNAAVRVDLGALCALHADCVLGVVLKGYVPYLEARTGTGYLVQVVVGNEVNPPAVHHGVLAYALDSEVFGVGYTRHLAVVARRTAVGNSRAFHIFLARNGV